MRIGHRIIAVLAVFLAVVAVMAGSRREMTGASEDLTGLSLFEREETIYFWYSEEDLSDFINGAAVAFGKEQDVRVIPQLVSESEYIEAINEATLHGGQMPDAYLVSNDSLEKAYLAGLACEIPDRDGICNEDYFSRGALSAVTYHGKKVAYPFCFDTTALVYNRTYLDMWIKQQEEGGGGEDGGGEEETLEGSAALLETGIPQTLDDILYIANTINVPDGVEGIMKWAVSDILYNYWVVGNYMVVGGEAGDSKTDVDINNEETLECLEVYKALNQFFYIEADNVTYDSSVQDFIDGKILFTIATTDVAGKLEKAKEEGAFAYEYGITVMPKVSTALDSRSVSVTTAVAVNGYSGHKELADQFAAFLAKDYSRNLYERTGRVAACAEANPEDGNLAPFLEEYASSIPLPKMISTSNLWIQLEVLFLKVWNGEDVPSLLKQLSDQIQMQLGTAIGREGRIKSRLYGYSKWQRYA